MSNHKNHLDNAYSLQTVDETRNFYADWAQTYDREIFENGYATPARCAAAVAMFVNCSATVLDVGCGTGLSGMALSKIGFSAIDGCDMTPEMLERAKNLNLYRNLWASEPNADLDFSRGPYHVVAAIGVIGYGAARMTLFYDILEQMTSGAHFVFSFNDHTLEDPTFERAVMNAVDGGAFALLFSEYGPHLAKRNMNSNVYVLQKQ